MLKSLIPLVGFRWTVRILALIVFLCLLISSFILRTRLPLKGTVSLADAVDFHGFKDRSYMLAGIGAFLCVFITDFVSRLVNLIP
jgi:MCP family monocarboxylic acid transporter-like MFS transporter 10